MKLIKSSKAKKIIGIALTVACVACMFITGASATSADGSEVVTMTVDDSVDAARELFSSVTQTLNFGSIAKVLSIGIGAAVGIWLAWWGIRKLIRVITNALQKGKLSL